MGISRQNTVVYLNSNSKEEQNLMACGVHVEFKPILGHDKFDQLEVFLNENPKWVFGYLGYDLKNELEDLVSENHDGLDFPKLCFFVPKVVFVHAHDGFEVLECYDHDYLASINPQELLESEDEVSSDPVRMISRTPKSEYLKQVSVMLDHIQRGDIYEANYCVEFYREGFNLAPLATYWKVNELTKAPFSAFFRHNEINAICGSPELFLERTGNRVVSKPIKGTRARGANEAEDKELKRDLLHDQKERSENVMIVDLVRNDLSKTAKRDTVCVDELYGIYSFETVHHLISTVTSEVDKAEHSCDILKSTFPMGSMTGAPKISAMKLIEKLENVKRGLYSGAIGYFNPEGDFKFNVVIRTLLYNSEKKYLSLMAGSAITIKSKPEDEYRECLLKAAALKKAIRESC